MRLDRVASAACLGLALAAAGPAAAQDKLNLGIVTFLTGAASGPFGIPARNAAELVIEAINQGTLPAPHSAKGMAGVTVEPMLVDESGTTTQVVQEFRNLGQRRNADAVVGYVSSGSCLGVAPVAEELKLLTVFFDCGTPRIFEEKPYQYVFRTQATATIDGVGAARYVLQKFPDIKEIAGINQNYAWGQDSWRDFAAAMQALKPDIKVATEQFPKLFAGQYSSEISALLLSNAQVTHSSLWGGDLESFIGQAAGRNLASKSHIVLTTGETTMFRMASKIPDGMILGGRGPYGVFANPSPLNDWFQKAYADRYGTPPTYPSYHMANAILGLKVAYDKAGPNGGKKPATDAVVKAFEHIEYDGFGTRIKMAVGKGHQAVTDIAYGTYKFDKEKGEPTVVDIKRYAAECVNPPDGVDSAEWIKGGMKGAKCG
jgi:branched-chain amino acid transport system substrate-binding protein